MKISVSNIFVQLLTALNVNNSHIQARIYFILLKNVLKQTSKSLLNNFPPHLKYPKNSYKVRKILAFFCNLIALILNEICVKCLRVAKFVKEIKFARMQGELKAKKEFPSYCLQNFVLVFLPLLTAPIGKRVIFRLEITLSC